MNLIGIWVVFRLLFLFIVMNGVMLNEDKFLLFLVFVNFLLRFFFKMLKWLGFIYIGNILFVVFVFVCKFVGVMLVV